MLSSSLPKLKLNRMIDLSKSFSSVLLRSSPAASTILSHQPSRTFKSDLKIKWVRPEKIPSIRPEKSGDLSPFPTVDTTQLHQDFVNSKALQEVNEEQKKLYTLDFLPRCRTREMMTDQAAAEVRRHDLDWGSMEVLITKMTVRIRSSQRHIQEFPADRVGRMRLKELIDKRKKFLKYLRRWDYKRFEWILEKLNIVYHPPPEEFHWITRKDSLRKLTNEHCDKIRQTRIDEYRKKLDAEKESFEKEKVELLAWIAEEERACGVTPQNSDDAVSVTSKS